MSSLRLITIRPRHSRRHLRGRQQSAAVVGIGTRCAKPIRDVLHGRALDLADIFAADSEHSALARGAGHRVGDLEQPLAENARFAFVRLNGKDRTGFARGVDAIRDRVFHVAGRHARGDLVARVGGKSAEQVGAIRFVSGLIDQPQKRVQLGH